MHGLASTLLEARDSSVVRTVIGLPRFTPGILGGFRLLEAGGAECHRAHLAERSLLELRPEVSEQSRALSDLARLREELLISLGKLVGAAVGRGAIEQ